MKIIKYWLPLLIWMIVIFTFSSFPTNKSSDFYLLDFLIKKSAHLIEYGILALLFYRLLRSVEVDKKKAVIYSILFCFTYGLSDEFHQSFTPGRGPKITDALIDATGATLFLYVFILKNNWFPKSIKDLLVKFDLV